MVTGCSLKAPSTGVGGPLGTDGGASLGLRRSLRTAACTAAIQTPRAGGGARVAGKLL